MLVASRLRSLLHSKVHYSEISGKHVNLTFLIVTCRFTVSHKSCGKVQDAYSLRCCPQVSHTPLLDHVILQPHLQVHGIAWDTIQFVEGIISTEMNSATDNPVSNTMILGC